MKSGSACYSVEVGDNLSTIAKHFYGNMDPENVQKIYYSNQKAIGSNPDLIRPGMKLYIPD
jgi:nucleoid-associated protein YgaU